MYVCAVCDKELSKCEIGKFIDDSLIVCWSCKVKIDESENK